MDPHIQTAARIIFGLFFVLAGSAGLIGAVASMVNYKNSRNWPECTATIVAAEDRGRTMRMVRFSYVFDAASYEVMQLISADSWTKELHSGKLVTIRHNPANPRTSILDHSEGVVNYLRLLLSAIWLTAGGALNYELLASFLGSSQR